MSLYSLLTVAGTASLAFGGNTKDRLSYSEDKPDYPSKKWASGKYDDSDRTSGYGHAYRRDPYERTYGRAYRYDPYERTYGKAYSIKHDPYWQTYGYAHSMHKDDDDKHYDDGKDYRSSKPWERPSYSSKDSKGWNADNYVKSYSYDPYERFYGKAYSTKDYKKDHIVEEPAVTASPQHWKKSDYSKPSRDWKKNDHEPKHEPKGHKDYLSKGHKDYEPKHDKKEYPSKHEPSKDYNDYSKDEPHQKDGKAYSLLETEAEEKVLIDDESYDDDGQGYAFYFFGCPSNEIKQLGESCTIACACIEGCCEGGVCVAKQKDWTNIFLYCPADCVGKAFGHRGTCS